MKEKDEKLITKVANFKNKIKEYLEYQEYLKMEAVCFDLHGEPLSQRRIPKLNAPVFFFLFNQEMQDSLPRCFNNKLREETNYPEHLVQKQPP